MLPADGASMCRSGSLPPLLPGVCNSSVRCHSDLRTEMGRDFVCVFILVMVCNVAPAFWCEFQPLVANCLCYWRSSGSVFISNRAAGCELWQKICTASQKPGKTPLRMQQHHIQNILFFSAALLSERSEEKCSVSDLAIEASCPWQIFRSTRFYHYELINLLYLYIVGAIIAIFWDIIHAYVALGSSQITSNCVFS